MNHTERRDDIVWAYAGLVTLLCLALRLGQASGEQFIGFAVPMVLMALLVLTISRLTADSHSDELRVSLGAGILGRRIVRTSIVGVTVAPPPSTFGVGVRLLPDGWLYSLGQVPAFVEMRLQDGSRLLIGSEYPQELAAAISQFIA